MDRRLLVAVDGSSASNAALLKAIELAREGDSELRVVHVLDETTVPWDEYGSSRRRRALEKLARASEAILKDAQETTRRSGRRASGVERVRNRWRESTGELIAAEARQWGADLIVIGSRGYGPIRRALFGSIDSAVMRAAPMSVLAVSAAGAPKTQRGDIEPATPHDVELA